MDDIKNTQVIVPARSRWRLEAETFQDLNRYAVSVQHDYYSKTIDVIVLDAIVGGKPIVHDWITKTLNSPGGETFTLYHHDANGNLLYKKILTEIKLIGHKSNLNYECDGDDLQDHELFFTYEEQETINNIN